MTRLPKSDDWRPALRGRHGPRYQAIADAIEADIASGRLAPGQPLPTQRELADDLGINFTTVTRAYTEARRRGLLTATVGRGTFVAPTGVQPLSSDTSNTHDLDLSVNAPPVPRWLPGTLRRTLEKIAVDEGSTSSVLAYGSRGGDAGAREAGLMWLRTRGLEPSPERVVVTAGAQHALALLCSTMAKPGETVLAESLSYPGLQSAADMAGVRLLGVPIDDEGVEPAALDALCKRHRPSLLFCVATFQNPTTAVMSSARRRALVAVARRRSLRIVEDDICGPLMPDATPLGAIAPDVVIHIASLSKCVAPGLRTAFVALPNESDAARLEAAVRSSLLMLSPLPLIVAATWIANGTAERAVADIRREATARATLARRILGETHVTAPPGSLHAWLELPDSWTVAAFVAQAQQLGVRVAPADWYVTQTERPQPAPRAVRLTLGAEPERARLELALRSLATLLDQAPGMRPSTP